jgi:hypothetical protein
MINNEIHALYSGNSPIPPDGYVLSIAGPQLGTIKEKAGLGQKIEAEFKIMTYAVSPGKILHVVAGGPRLLKNGMVYVSKHEENFKADVAKKKAARTAVGITKEKDLLLVTVQGPPNDGENNSRGATLEDLSHLMQALGAVDAMNLDGGSSTAMVVKDRLVSGSRRKVSNAILVFSREF